MPGLRLWGRVAGVYNVYIEHTLIAYIRFVLTKRYPG